MTVVNSAAAGEAANNVDKKVTFKSCASFTSCITTINNTQIDDAQYIDLVMFFDHPVRNYLITW